MKSIKQKPNQADDGFKFEVGAMYENMKGVYEVLSIKNDSMVIRWNDGTEVATPIELQKRIMERMAYEERARQQQKVKELLKARKKQKTKR
jgi:hypothetical protein